MFSVVATQAQVEAELLIKVLLAVILLVVQEAELVAVAVLVKQEILMVVQLAEMV
jgi:hypothetical protein